MKNKTTIRTILNSLNPKIKDIVKIYKGFFLNKLSFNNNIENLKFYKEYKTNKEIAYISLSDKENFSFTAIIEKEDFLKSKKEYDLDKTKSIDASIFDIKIDKNGKLLIYLNNIKEAGLSELELEKRKIKKYCLEKKYFDLKNKKLEGFINRIALITTSGGNTESDILKQIGLNLENNLNKVDVFKTKSYSDLPLIIKKVNQSKNYQLVVLFRGGNEDKYMINFSKIPVIEGIVQSDIITASAIGHQSDHPIIQDIVDLGYDTPSSFAKAIKKHNDTIIDNLYLIKKEIDKKINNIYNNIQTDIKNKNKLIKINSNNILKQLYKNNNSIYNDLNLKIDNLIENKKNYEIIKKQKKNIKIAIFFSIILIFIIIFLMF